MNEAELVAYCKQKKPSAQAELYRRYAGEMFALCIRYAGNRDTAKDLLHDGFLKAFTSLDKFDYRGEGSLKAWLSRIMVNTALEEARKQAQRPDVGIDDAPEIADPDSEDDGIVQNIAPEILLRFISELPDGYRTVFNLFTFENKSHKEIAHLLHINEKSSSSQLYRARTLLINRVKDYLEKHGDE
ncbi:MAG TPA: sigma-70 family RNA polymerase sigma factor [Candidatus Barnesiella excrementigallinarum]|nr:sigma-70 family RNA polymerase sigma factor [Candidatus Barnesiella excrementigallinarum]